MLVPLSVAATVKLSGSLPTRHSRRQLGENHSSERQRQMQLLRQPLRPLPNLHGVRLAKQLHPLSPLLRKRRGASLPQPPSSPTTRSLRRRSQRRCRRRRKKSTASRRKNCQPHQNQKIPPSSKNRPRLHMQLRLLSPGQKQLPIISQQGFRLQQFGPSLAARLSS